MLTSDVKSLIERGNFLFGRRGNLLSFWQDVAEQFFCERATFTAGKTPGEDFAAYLATSYPLIVRRELGNAIAAMLRPRGEQWGAVTIEREERLDRSGREWCEFATGVQWRAMYDRKTQFVRATKEGDHDFATFGQAVITRDINWRETALLYQCHHLRDCAWAENETGEVDELHVDIKITAGQLVKKFKGVVHDNVTRCAAREPHKEIQCRRVLMPWADYTDEVEQRRHPELKFMSVYVDVDNQFLLEKRGRRNRGFTLPRWQTVSGSPYAYSPAVTAGLPDARLLQAMTLTLLEAGEGAVRPPMLGNQDAVTSDVKLYPGGVTWAHLEEGGKLAEALTPVFQEKAAISLGLEMNQDTREMIAAAFYLNKLTLPPAEREMTAYETAQRLQEWIRSALPLFEPMEQEYNGALCEDTFDDLMGVGAFGPTADIPDSLRGAEVRFKFKSPLHEAVERKKAHTFMETRDMLAAAAEIDRSAANVVDVRTAFREALEGIGTPAKWLRDEEVVEQMSAEQAAAAQAEQAAVQIAGGAEAARAVGEAEQALNAA